MLSLIGLSGRIEFIKKSGVPPAASCLRMNEGPMQTKEFCVYNETRENFLSAKVTVIDTKSDPLKAVKVLIEGLGPNADTGLWLNPLKSVPTVPRLSPYDLVYLDEDCRVMHGVALVPDDEVPRFDGHATSALLLPIHTFSTSQSHPGDQVVICSAEEMEHRPVRLPVLTLPVPAYPVLVGSKGDEEIDAPVIAAWSNPFQTAIVPSEAVAEVPSPTPKKDLSKIRFLRDIVRLRVHISISIGYASSARSDALQTSQSTLEPGVERGPGPAAKRAAELAGEPADQLSTRWSLLKEQFLRKASKFFSQAKEIVLPQRVRTAVAAASGAVAKTTRAATTNLAAECTAEWNVLKSCGSFCGEAFLRRCVLPSIATVSQHAAKATRGCSRILESWKIQYSIWAEEFMFRPARIENPSTHPATKRPAVRIPGHQWLKARFLR